MTDAVVIAAAPDLRVWSAPLLAFIAGVASFASPCVFPLVPGYIAFVVGGRGATAAPTGDRRRHVLPIVLFILGFSTIFVVLGAASATWVPLVRGRSGQVLAGGYICLVGLTMLATARGRGPMRILVERRPLLARARPGAIGALPLGMAFAAGWTPCIGPVLGAILTLAAMGGTARAVMLLSAYSLGLGLPFLLLGLGIQRFTSALAAAGLWERWFGSARARNVWPVSVDASWPATTRDTRRIVTDARCACC